MLFCFILFLAKLEYHLYVPMGRNGAVESFSLPPPPSTMNCSTYFLTHIFPTHRGLKSHDVAIGHKIHGRRSLSHLLAEKADSEGLEYFF